MSYSDNKNIHHQLSLDALLNHGTGCSGKSFLMCTATIVKC